MLDVHALKSDSLGWHGLVDAPFMPRKCDGLSRPYAVDARDRLRPYWWQVEEGWKL